LNIQKKIATLKSFVAKENIRHQQELSSMEARLSKSNAESMQRMKEKYMETVKAMKEEITRSAEVSGKNFESEWAKKKEKLDQNWMQK
jgi:hypothetical protein